MEKLGIQILLNYQKELKKLEAELNKLQSKQVETEGKSTQKINREKIKTMEQLHDKAIALNNTRILNEEKSRLKSIERQNIAEQKAIEKRNALALKLETARQQKILENSKRFATEYAKTKGVADISTTALGEGTIQSYKMGADGKFTQTLKTANGEIVRYKGNVDKATGSLKIMSSETMKVNKEIKTQEGLFSRLGSTMVKNTLKFAEWMISGTAIMQTIRTVQSAIRETIAMDTAMTGLSKVSGESKENLEQYKSTVYETAKSMGTLTTDVVDATAVFARAGYTLSESSDLGKSAILLSNVADSFQDVSTSGEQIISILKGFGLESNRAFDVVDKLNELSNKYNITNVDLSMGLQRTAAVMAGFGNDIDETSALLTGSIEVLGNWEKSSRGLNSIGARLRGLTEDGEKDGEMIATLDKLFNEFGLTLMKNDGTFKSTFDIINDLASVQDTLGKQDPNKFQYLLEKIAGKDQLPVLQSLLANIDAVNSALEASKNAYGSAEEEQARYLDSIEGRLKTTKASIQEFYQSFAATDTIKTAVTEFGKFIEVLTAVNESVGLIPIAFGIATASIALFNKELIFTSGVAMVNLIKDLPLIIASVRQFGLAALFAANGIGLMHAAMIPLVAIAGLAIWTIQKVAEEEKYFAEQAENATKFSQNQTQAFKDNKASADELINSLSDLANAKSLTVEQDKRVEEITAQISKMYPDLLSNMDKEGNKLVNLVNAYNAVTKAALQSQVARLSSETVNLEDQLAKERNPVTNDKWGIRSAIAQQGGIETVKTKILDTQITARKDALRKAMDELESFKGITIEDLKSTSPPPGKGGSGGVGGTSSSTKDKTDQFASYKNAIEDVNHALTILSSKESIAISDPDKIKILTEQNEKYNELQQRVHEYENALREEQKGYAENSAEYRELQEEIQKQSEAWWANEAAIEANINKIHEMAREAIKKQLLPELEAISKILERTQKDFESSVDKRIDSYEAELDALKKKQKALEQEEERLKIIKDLEEARLKLRNIQNEKNVQLYTGQGATGWEWVADPAQLESAGEAVADLEEKLREFDLDATRQAEQDKLQAKIDALEAQKQAEQQKYNERKQKFDDFENYIKTQMEANDDIKLENLNDFLSSLTEDEIASYGTRIEELRKFVASWNAQVAQMKMLGATGGGSYGGGGSSSGSKTVLVGPDGKAPPGLSAGDRVMTGGGTYRIDKVKSDGSYESTKVDNQKASQPKGKAVGGPVSAGQTYEVNELGLEAMMTKRNGRDYLTPLTSGKILTASQTKSALAGVGGGNISIGNINLPNVREPEDFMPALIQSIKTFARNS